VEDELIGFEDTGAGCPEALCWRRKFPDGSSVYRLLTDDEVHALNFRIEKFLDRSYVCVVNEPNGREHRTSTVRDFAAAIFGVPQRWWPDAWKTAVLEAEEERKQHAVKQRRSDQSSSVGLAIALADRREEAEQGPWKYWVNSSEIPVGEDPPLPEGWHWAVTPSRVRAHERHRTIWVWIRSGGTPPWEKGE
jgi:hypothetical protein